MITIHMPRRFMLMGAFLMLGQASPLFGISFQLGQSKEELKLQYNVKVTDHGTGRVTVVFTLTDEGRIAPVESIEFAIPAEKKNSDGSYWMDLVIALDMTEKDSGKRVGRVHIRRDLARRATIRLHTRTMDGKLDPFTRLFHVIQLGEMLENAQTKSTTKPIAPDTKSTKKLPPATLKESD